MYRVKSHLWPLCRAFIEMWCLGQQVLLHVWAKIAPRVRFSCLLYIVYISPSKIDERFGYIRTSGSLVAFCSPSVLSTCKNQWMFRLKSHFWPAWRLHLFGGARPSNKSFWCLKDTYFTSFSLFEATLGRWEKHVFYGPFEALRGLRKWRDPARGTILAETFVVFSKRKRSRTLFLRTTEVLFST